MFNGGKLWNVPYYNTRNSYFYYSLKLIGKVNFTRTT